MKKRKVVLITGASRGIGKAVALLLAEKGYDLILNYHHSEQEILVLEQRLQQYNINVMLYKADISIESEVSSMVLSAIKTFNRIDILINNAGIAIDTTFEDKKVKSFQKVLNVNLIGPFLTSKYVSKYMLENKVGKIINISSTNGIDTGYPEGLDYDASKAGLNSLTHNLARQLAPYVTVNAIACGWVKTDMNQELDKDFIKEEELKILLNRFADPKEIANVVAFLISDEASYINSSIIRVDGGLK